MTTVTVPLGITFDVPAGEQGPKGADGVNGTNGVDGARGLDGAPGNNGTDGAAGAAGRDGTNGTNGADGTPGANGADGTHGTNGVDGAPGHDGVNGTNGVDGAHGEKGDKGDRGDPGEPGAAGPAGPAGAVGPAGPGGPTGPKGDKGDKGDPGAGGVIAVPGGATDVTDALQASVNAASAAHVPLVLPPGLYTISPRGAACLWILNPINIIASPDAVIRMAPGSNYSTIAMVLVRGDNVSIEGGTWDFNSANITGSGAGTIVFAQETDHGGGSYTFPKWFSLRKAHLINATSPSSGGGWGEALNISNASQVWIENNYFANCNAGHISYKVWGGPGEHLYIRNNYIDGSNTVYECINIINVSGATQTLKYFEVTGNTMIGPPAGPLSCSLQVWQNTSANPAGNMHHGVIADNISIGSGIGLSVTGLEDSTVTGNTVLGAHLGIENGSCINTAFNGNSINGMGVGNYGLGIDGVGTGCTTNNNTITNLAGNASAILSIHNRMTINGNAIYMPYGSGRAITGINIFSYSLPNTQAGFTTLNGNMISLAGASGAVSLADASNVVSTGNQIDIETPTYASYVIAENNPTVLKDHIYIAHNILPQSKPAASVAGNYGKDIRVESYNADGSTTKWSSGWNANLTLSVAPGTATQTTSKSTALTSATPSLNIYALNITMHNAALAAGAVASFAWPNTLILATDMVDAWHMSGGTFGAYAFNARCSAGSVTIDVTNISTASKAEAIVIRAAIRRSL